MEQIIVVCGNWYFEKNRWLFYIENDRGTKLLPATEATSYEQFMSMVYEDYGFDREKYRVELSYILPKNNLLMLDTPPVKVDTPRQFKGFLNQFKYGQKRLCAQVSLRVGDKEQPSTSKFIESNIPNEEEEDEDEEDRFDCCDDSDGASSDEDFSCYGVESEEAADVVDSARKDTTIRSKYFDSPTHVRLELNSLTLSVGEVYASKTALETKLKILAVVNQYDFNIERSSPTLLIVSCWVKGCTWKIRASPVGVSTQFTIRQYEAKHTCSVTERSGRSRQATPDILALLYVDFIGGVEQSVLPSHVATSLNKCFGVKLEYWKAHRTLQKARDLVRGSAESGYAELPMYLHMIRRANPGTLTRLEVDASNRFKYLFLAFGASINGFPFMRKVVVVDGTFLQGKYKGTLLMASSHDGNFQIFPLAFAVVDTENDDSWKWFFKQLSLVIPDVEGLAIISDRHKSISNAIREVYPKASRGICTYHLYKNIIVKFRGKELFGLVKKAATAYQVAEFETIYDQIKMANPALHAYLERAGVTLWARAHFPGDRYNLITTNIAESMNRAISSSRSLPIVRLLEAIRLMMTRWFSQRKNDANLMKTTLTRGVEKFLEKRVAYAKTLNVQAIDVHQSQVTGVSSLHVVNLHERKCTCRKFDLEKLPCVHAIAAAEARKISRISLCHPYFRTSYLFNGHSTPVMPKDASIALPENIISQACLPPLIRQPPGRPKKSRFKSCLEKGLEKKRPRKEHVCSKCGQVGHNLKTCLVL